MSERGAICIMWNKDAMRLLSNIQSNSQKPRAAWHAALATLDPDKKGTQVVTVSPDLLPGAQALVEAGLFKPYAKTKNKFTISRKHAFAAYENEV